MQWVCRAVTTAAESPEPWEPHCSPARLGSARPDSPVLGHGLSKERTPFSDKQAVGRVPAACFWTGKAAPWTKAGPRHWKNLTLQGLGGFAECHGGSCCAQCARTHQWQILSSTRWWSSLLQVLGIKSPYAAPPEQTDIYLIICSMGPNQRHDSNCTICRHLGTYHISKSGVAVSTTLQLCGPYCSAFPIPKNMHLAKREGKDSLACVVLPVCFSSAAKCSWSSVLNF